MVTFTATVGPVAPSNEFPTGSVEFYNGSTLIGTAAPGANGTASITTNGMAAGPQTLTAVFSGKINFTAAPLPR